MQIMKIPREISVVDPCIVICIAIPSIRKAALPRRFGSMSFDSDSISFASEETKKQVLY